jgi:phenylacetic acid degradation operon negative regulatory protein
LTTVLGEFVRPGTSVWTATFIAALRSLGVEEQATRQALARSATAGLIVAERVGRRTRWALSDSGAELLDRGATRIYGFLRDSRQWDGRWLVLAVSLPESRRSVRRRLRTRLEGAGFGSPSPGLWVVPDVSRAAEAQIALADLGLTGGALSWFAEAAEVGNIAQLVASAWRLDELRQAYCTFVAAFGGREVDAAAEAFSAHVELLRAWRRFPFSDPQLPAELLPQDWPGPLAAAEFHRCAQRWSRRAHVHWQMLCRAANERS